MTNKAIIKTIDIETLPLESYTWGTFQQDVGVEQIKTEWTILSFAIKTLGDPKIRYMDTGGRGKKNVRNDKSLCLAIKKELDECDLLIAQNGRAFDTKKINARLCMHGILPYSPVRIIDTLEIAKKHFKFTSNRLAWLTKNLTDLPKDDHKEYPGFDLWLACMEDDPKAFKCLKKYNETDVLGAEKTYLRFLPWIAQHPNLGVYTGEVGHVCPNCGSTDVQQRGTQVTQSATYHRYHCQACGKWSRGKEMLTPPRKRKSLLVSS